MPHIIRTSIRAELSHLNRRLRPGAWFARVAVFRGAPLVMVATSSYRDQEGTKIKNAMVNSFHVVKATQYTMTDAEDRPLADHIRTERGVSHLTALRGDKPLLIEIFVHEPGRTEKSEARFLNFDRGRLWLIEEHEFDDLAQERRIKLHRPAEF